MVKPGVSRGGRFLLLAGCASLLAAPTFADDLREALVLAYNTNPTLQSARAQQRATDEGVPLARSAGLPSASGNISHTEFTSRTGSAINPNSPERNFDVGVSFSVPLYSGGSVKNSVRAAETRVVAGQSDLRGTESEIFVQVVAAYMDVLLAQEVVKLNRGNVERLDVNLQATKDRFEIGDLTRTDVAQSDSRLALARGQLRSAEANLIGARERYIQVVGKEPTDLKAPPPLLGLPENAEAAMAYALDHNPDLLAAQQRAKAAGYDVRVAGASRMPRVSLFAGADYTDYFGTLGGVNSASFDQSGTSTQAGVRATIPLFQGGAPSAQRRAAQARQDSAMEQVIGIERGVIANVRSAFAQWQASLSLISSSQSAVDAAMLGLEGVRAENTVGNRTILDILNAEQELLSAQVQLETAKRNAYVAGFNLLATMGKAEARDLGLDGGILYDPEVNAGRVSGRIWDWSNDPDPATESTRTVDTRAQDGSVTGQ
ncbi:MAG: TolC family outer membrane protein [Novosphingobium sp.]|uniref:TolC family outer membrane protein n=1 Tax=Novosphingobium sp. TaxID=1874826 RepID=UPI0032BB204E